MKKKAAVYPSKTSLNLCVREESQFSPKKLIPALLIILVLAALFGKFAVADRFAALYEVQAQAAALSNQKASLAAATADYNAVLEEYERYSTDWMNSDEMLAVERTHMLDLVESEFMSRCQVRNIVISGNILSVQLGGVSLDDVSGFVQTLYERSDIVNVAVYTASAEDGEGSLVSMVVTMSKEFEGGEQG